MGMMLRLLRSVVGVITYPYVMAVLHNDKFERANGNLSPNAPWVHSAITTAYNRILDGKAVGPASSYSLDIADIRIPNKSGYIRARITTPSDVMRGGGKTRLNIKSGRSYNASTSSPTNTFQSAAFYIQSNGKTVLAGQPFLRGWGVAPDWALKAVTDIDQYRPNDEIAIMWLGRAVIVFYNGTRSDFRLTDEQWTPGYFAGIGLDTGHSFEEVEVGYFGPLELREYGDSFKSPKLDNVWNLSPNKTVVVDEGVQSDPVSAAANGTFLAGGVSKQQMHEDDQIIRGILKAPSGVTGATSLGAMLLGRCGSAIVDTIPYVMFYITTSGTAAIYTVLNGANTLRFSAAAGAVSYPAEIELQCIGNRYFGLLNGQPVCEWQDATNIVPIGEGRRGWGWQTSVARNSTTYTYGPAFDSVYSYGNENMTLGSPEVFGVSSPIVPLAGAGSFVVQGTNFTAATKVFVGGTLCTLLNRWSSNEIEFVLPAKAAGTYDLTVTSPFGDATLVGAVQYVAQVPYGKYDPTPTVLPGGIVYTKVPLSPENAAMQTATVDGVIVGLPRGFYRFRTTYTVSYFRTDIRHRLSIPAGTTDPKISSEGSSGAVDKTTEFSVGANGTVELQFARSASASKTIDATFDFELILVSTTRLPAGLVKSGTHVLGTVASVYEKVMGWSLYVDYDATTTATGDEILVSADGDYTLEFQATYSTSNTANIARVTNQLGTVLATKTNPTSLTTVVVSLKKGDSIKLEAMTTNVSTVARRTITAANTLFRITPV